MAKKISIVIPAFNEEKFLPTCLDSLVHQKTIHDFEVLVVDNASTDKTRAVANSFKNKLNIKIISESKRGRGAARATGFNQAHGSIICSTDADIILPQNWIEKIIKPFENPLIVATTCTCKIVDLSPIKNKILSTLQPIAMKVFKVIFKHYWLSGFNFAIRKEIYRKTHGFNRKLNAQEDIQLGFEVMKLGTIELIPDNPVIFSGRRFKNGILRGLFPYLQTFIKYYFFKDNTVVLSDVRV